MIRILLAEDQALVRGALRVLLELEPDLEVVADVGAGDAILATARDVEPDVALLDIELPGLDGLSAACRLTRELPDCKVLMLTSFGRAGYLQRAMEAGAAGFLLKDRPPEELATSIRQTVAGRRIVDHALAIAALDEPNPLTARERDVLAAARDGAKVSEIARRLCLARGTVRNYLSQAMSKTGAASRAEAVLIATEAGWLSPRPPG